MPDFKTMSNGVVMTVHADGKISMRAKRDEQWDQEFASLDPKFVAALKEHFTGELAYVKPPEPEFTPGVYQDRDGDLWIYRYGEFFVVREDGSIDDYGSTPQYVTRNYAPITRYTRP